MVQAALAQMHRRPRPIVQQVAAQIPWFHNCILMDRIKNPKEREWYISQTVENGWSRNVLVHQIESGLYRRQGKALTNFARTLPRPHCDLARETLPARFKASLPSPRQLAAELQKLD